MKIKNTIKPTFLALLSTLAVSGCAVSSGVKFTEIKNEKRLNLRFSNAKAASIFYQTFFENVDKTETTKNLNVYIKLKLEDGIENQVSDNVKLNDAFRAADKNKNGVVSEAEAIAYVQSLH